MGIMKQIQVTCDECGSECDSTEYTVAQARMGAREDGWKRRNGRDICPNCQEEQAIKS
jgi:hypothetical protein